MVEGSRYLVVYLPAFPLERCGYGAADLAGLIAEEKSAMRLQAVTPAARKAGLRPFMTATEARALVPEVELIPQDLIEEQRDRASLIQRFTEISDRVRAPWPDTLVAEITGTSRFFGGEEAQRARSVALARRLGHDARAVVSDDPRAARALARWGREGVVPAGGGRGALAELPLEALEPSESLLGALRSVGIERVDAFARLDPAAVAHRFGAEGGTLHALARGHRGAALPEVAADDSPVRVRTALAGATSLLQLHFVLPGLLGELSVALAQRGLAAVRLRIVLQLERVGEGSSHWGIGVTVGRPTRDVPTLERLVRLRLEGAKLTAPVDELAIEVVEGVPEVGWQPGLTDRTEATEPLPDVLARLADHLGPASLCGAEVVERWKPEAAWKAVAWPPGALFGARRADGAAARAQAPDPVVLQQHHEVPQLLPRPAILLQRPDAVEVRLEQGRLAAVRLPRGWSRVARCDGPERLRSDWWCTEAWSRDYWVAELGDRTAWLFVDGRGRWHVHGWFD
jgi:protein ImuB